MATLKCSDLGMECDHVITGETASEVKQMAFAHARDKHADVLKTMAAPEQMAQMEKLIDAKIQQ